MRILKPTMNDTILDYLFIIPPPTKRTIRKTKSNCQPLKETMFGKTTIIDPGTLQVKLRQHKMFNEIKHNFINSHLNLNDPGNFYKNWLIDIHQKNEEKDKRVHEKHELNIFSKRLGKVHGLFKCI